MENTSIKDSSRILVWNRSIPKTHTIPYLYQSEKDMELPIEMTIRIWSSSKATKSEKKIIINVTEAEIKEQIDLGWKGVVTSNQFI